MTELLLHERQARIQDLLQATGRVLAAELAGTFGVSEDTIRRDLREMAASGLCRRVYGGALALAPSGKTLSERGDDRTQVKAALAAALLPLIEPGMTVFLDASSVNMALARLIGESDMAVIVATNTPAIATLLLDAPAVELIVIGGPIDRRVSAAVGARALRDAALLRPDLCFLGVCGIAAGAGVTAHHLEDAEFKRAIAVRSRAVALAVTSDKLDTVAAHDVVPLDAVAFMAVEADAGEAPLAAFAAAGVRMLKAGA